MIKPYSFVVLFLLSGLAFSQNEPEWLIDSGLTFNHYQAQIKAEVGDPRGERLANIFELGINVIGSYKWNKWFATGLFFRADRGQRDLAKFNGFDDSGKTTIKDKVGGTYSELWIGPVIHAYWKQLTLELGYAAFGIRKDNGRRDIPNSSGETKGSFTLNPKVAWMVNVGGFIPLSDNIDASLKIEYRGRYYLKRDGKKLLDNIDHGTQSIVPVIGLRLRIN
ncbi:MAG: hypothetical protein D8M58_14700 [Calditrichaeota bacterium]|nr:MAG: hypothetical protein DWQ03_15940 [Calditrichota bacterium]MBL1206652.1 hypothetical protein [Calditrichota bacterium]NOG46479.1 hypothetical protein [Calditrichota bacterium]